MKVGLSVVIPAYNEQDNTASCLTKVSSVLKKSNFDWEIIFVNDGSKDKTGEIARSFLKKIPHLKIVENKPNRGYGGSLKAGFDSAAKEFIAFTPADNQFDFSEIHKLFAVQNRTGADIVSGIRVGGGVDPLPRRLNRFGWNAVVTFLFGKLATDIDCGFKLFRSSVLHKVTLTSRGALIDTQLFAGAKARGLKIAEIPVTHLPRVAGSATGANPKVIIKAFKELFIFWWQLRNELLAERNLSLFRWEIFSLILILGIASFSRLYHIESFMTFLGDEGRDALVVRDIILGRHFPLIGPGTSVGNMYLGPLYYYLIAPALFVSRFSPVGPSVLVALIGVVTVGMLWWIGRNWFGRTPALIVSLIYAISPAVIIYSRSSWNPNVMPFFSLLSMYCLWQVWNKGKWAALPLGAVGLAFALNSHYLALLLVPCFIIFLTLSKRNSTTAKNLLISVGLFASLMSPLVIFDARHNWINFSSLYTFFINRQQTVNLKVYKAGPNFFPVWQDFVNSLLTADNALFTLVLTAILAVFVVYRLYKFKIAQNKDLLFVLTWISAGILGLSLYKQHVYS